jgi:hypothetical protein
VTSVPARLAAVGARGVGLPDGRGPADAGGAEEAAPSAPPASAGGGALLRAGLRGLLGHALVDTVFYAVTFAEPFGLPLAGLGAMHLGLDVIAWTVALAPLREGSVPARSGNGRGSGGTAGEPSGEGRLQARTAGTLTG